MVEEGLLRKDNSAARAGQGDEAGVLNGNGNGRRDNNVKGRKVAAGVLAGSGGVRDTRKGTIDLQQLARVTKQVF